MGTNLVYQAQENGCGYAAVKMMLIHLSGEEAYRHADEPIVEEAPSLASIIAYAKGFGLSLEAYHVGKRDEIAENKVFPLLVLLQEGELLHMVFLQKKRGKRYLILDPSAGKRWMDEKDLIASFACVVLMVDSFQAIPSTLERKARPVSLRRQIALIFTSMMPLSCLIGGLLILEHEWGKILSMCLFSVGIGSVVVDWLLKKRWIRQFDQDYSGGIDDENVRLRKEKFIHYHRYKAAAFSSTVSFSISILGVAAAGLLFALQSVSLCIGMSIVIVYVTIDQIYLSPKRKKEKLRLASLERQYQSTKRAEIERKVMLRSIQKEGDRFSHHLSVRYFLSAIICFGAALLACYLDDSITLASILFNALWMVFFLRQCNGIFTHAEALEEKRKEESYFLLHFVPSDVAKEEKL